MKIRALTLGIGFVLFATACGQVFTPFAPIDAGVTVHADPAGDAGSPPTFDVIELRAVRGASEIRIRLWTTPDPVLPPSGASPSASQFSGGVGFDTDLDASTGGGFVPPCGGNEGLERFVDLTARNADGTYSVRSATTLAVTGFASVSQDGPRVTFTVPFGALGTATGRTQVSAVIGVGAFPFIGKDCVPDAGQAMPTRVRTGRHPVLW